MLDQLAAHPRSRPSGLACGPLAPADAPRLAELANDFDVVKMTGGMPYPYTLADAEALRPPRRRDADPDREIHFAIELGGEGPVGCVGFYPHETPGPELGYWLGQPYWGRGDRQRDAGGDHAVGAGRLGPALRDRLPLPDNPASGAALIRAGFLYTGVVEPLPCNARGEDGAVALDGVAGLRRARMSTPANLLPGAFAGAAAAYARYRPPYPKPLLDDLLARAASAPGRRLAGPGLWPRAAGAGPGGALRDCLGARSGTRDDRGRQASGRGARPPPRQLVRRQGGGPGRATGHVRPHHHRRGVPPAGPGADRPAGAGLVEARRMSRDAGRPGPPRRPGELADGCGRGRPPLDGQDLPWRLGRRPRGRRGGSRQPGAGAATGRVRRRDGARVPRTARLDLRGDHGYLQSTSVCSTKALGGDFAAFEAELRAALLDPAESQTFHETMAWGYTLGRRPR